MAGQYTHYPVGGSGGAGVSSLNGLTGALTLAAGTGITITPSGGDTLTIAAGGTSPGGTSGQVQYNNSGAFGGFGSWNGTTLAITGAISSTTTLAVGTNLHVFGTSIMAGDMVVQGGANFSGNLGFYGVGEIAQPTGNVLTALSNLGLVSGPTLSLANLPAQANNTILGNNSGISASPSALTVAQINAILPVFTSSLNGLAPLSGGGTANYLRADGTWAAPPGATSGTVTSVGFSVPGSSIFGATGSPVTTSGTLGITTTGTSGGVPYFDSTSTLSSSALLTNNAIMLGGGSAAAPKPLASLGTTTTVLHGNAAGAPTFGAVSLTADVSGTLPVGNGGTGLATLTANNVILGNGASNPTFVAPSTSGNVLTSNGTTWASTAPAPATAINAVPTTQNFTSGSGTYNKNYTFVISSGSATVGATYTNNAVTFTVYATVASATQVVMSGSGAPTSSGTLTKASGTGDATLTFSQVLAPLFLQVTMVGGGGGGGGSGAGGTAGSNGGNTTFGSSLLTANGGVGGPSSSYGGAGGTATIGTGARGIAANGSQGEGSSSGSGATNGGSGGNAPFFSGAGTSVAGAAGQAAATNSGSGGGGGGGSAVNSGAGGGSGGFVQAIIAPVSATYSYAVGALGANGAGGTGGTAGGNGAAGIINVVEYYQ